LRIGCGSLGSFPSEPGLLFFLHFQPAEGTGVRKADAAEQ